MKNLQNIYEDILVMDIGGTFIKSAVFRDGNLICKLPQIPSCSNGTREEIINAVRSAVSQAGEVSRIAVSIPGPFDFVNGIFLMEHKFAAVKGCSFAEIVGNIPTCFIHDANAFLLGEQLHGAGRGFLRVGGITLGTGLGAAFTTRLFSSSPAICKPSCAKWYFLSVFSSFHLLISKASVIGTG